MKKAVLIVILFLSVFAVTGINTASAQCAMCTINAEQGTKNGNTQAKGINSGVIYLMAIPYLLIAGMGVLWYKKYRTARTSTPS
jgi:H+/Cl- antiporter ClcA